MPPKVPALSVPPIVVFASYASICLLSISAAVMLFPTRVAKMFPKPVRTLRAKLFSWVRRARELSVEGPIYKLTIWWGRKLGRGFLASRCQAPDIRAKPGGSREVQVTLTPRLPYNPFHEEQYMLSWCREDEETPIWREKCYDPKCDCEVIAKGRVRVYLEGLPENTPIRVRARAVNARGHSEWTKEIPAETLAPPSEDGGYTGPLGPACEDGAYYTWGQTKTEVTLWVPLRPEWTAKNIKFKWTPSRLELRCSANGTGADEVLIGPLNKRVKSDEVFWSIEEDKKFGRHLYVQMVKVEALDKWSCVIEAPGHPQVDTRLLRFFTDGMSGLGDLSGLAGLK